MEETTGDALNQRMCKKIADLIKVIDKLFRQFYEQSILYSSIKEKLELRNEDKRRTEAAAENLKMEKEKLGVTVQQLERELSSLKTLTSDKEKELVELQEKLKQVMVDNKGMEQEIVELKEMLQVQVAAEHSRECTSCNEYTQELVVMKNQVEHQLEKLEELENDNNSLKIEKSSLKKELKETSVEMESLKEELSRQISSLSKYQLENEELKTNVHELNVKLKSKASVVKKGRKEKSREYWLETPQVQVGKESSDVEYLKQEIQRYKMELINRETNFNRVFSSSRRTPIRPAVPPPTYQDEFEARTCPLIRKGKSDVQLPKLSSHKLGRSLI